MAEAHIAVAAIDFDALVLRPAVEGGRYDLAIDFDPVIVRVQCKLAHHVDGVLRIGLRTNRCTPNGYVSTRYSSAEIDAFGVYSPHTRGCYLIPIDEVDALTMVYLRLAPARNNQAVGVRWAADYAFERVAGRYRDGLARGAPTGPRRTPLAGTMDSLLGL